MINSNPAKPARVEIYPGWWTNEIPTGAIVSFYKGSVERTVVIYNVYHIVIINCKIGTKTSQAIGGCS